MMSPAQTNALNEVQAILTEHFPASIVVVEFDADEDGKTSLTAMARNASNATAIGLCEVGKDIIRTAKSNLTTLEDTSSDS